MSPLAVKACEKLWVGFCTLASFKGTCPSWPCVHMKGATYEELGIENSSQRLWRPKMYNEHAAVVARDHRVWIQQRGSRNASVRFNGMDRGATQLLTISLPREW